MRDQTHPVIAVSAWGDALSGRAPRFACSRSYLEAVEAAGGAPFSIPPMSEMTLRTLYELADGLVLTGGGDVDPARYGEDPIPQLGYVDPERDEAELKLAAWALEDNKPLLAICRGAQVLNVACGGGLYQDLPVQRPSALNHNESRDRGIRGLPTHSIEVAPGSRLERAIGEGTHSVNTHHHQAVKDIGKGLAITGTSEDEVVEAIESESLSWVVGIQCHPEEMWREHPWATRLFEAFVQEAVYQAQERPPKVVGALKEPTG